MRTYAHVPVVALRLPRFLKLARRMQVVSAHALTYCSGHVRLSSAGAAAATVRRR
jgi:hypothetical protein